MLPIRLDDVFSALGTTNDKSAILGLDEYIPWRCPLDVIHYLPNWATLSNANRACSLRGIPAWP
jgi:hypothetical protein